MSWRGLEPQTYRPLEALFVIAALTSLAENFLPQLIAVPRVSLHALHMVLAQVPLFVVSSVFR